MVTACEDLLAEEQPRPVEEASFCNDGEGGRGITLTTPCGVLAPPVIASTAILMLAGSTDNKADRAISFEGLK